MIKKVKKHWGHELWIEEGIDAPYALKRIKFLAGNRTSLQVHQKKYETNYVLSGTGKLYISNEPFDIQKFLQDGMTPDQILEYEKSMKIIDLLPESVFTVRPRYAHRVVATTDLEFIEASTSELDDVIRLQDDKGRTHGKIQSEHE